MVKNHIIASLCGARHLSESSAQHYESLTEVPPGCRLSSLVLEAAGSTQSIRLEAQIDPTGAAPINLSSAICFSQTQEDYLSKVAKALDRMGELSILAQDSIRTNAERALYSEEFGRHGEAVTEVRARDYNGRALFLGAPLKVTTEVGGQPMTLLGVDLISSTNSSAAASTVDSMANARMAWRNVRTAIDQLSADRAIICQNLSVLESCGAQSMERNIRPTEASRQNQDADVAVEGTQSASLAILAMAETIVLDQASSLKASDLKAGL